jgi:NADPH-dependent curcumin reductase
LDEVGKLFSDGKLKYKEDVSQGLENAIDSFISVMEGKNFGKAMIQISD